MLYVPVVMGRVKVSKLRTVARVGDNHAIGRLTVLVPPATAMTAGFAQLRCCMERNNQTKTGSQLQIAHAPINTLVQPH